MENPALSVSLPAMPIVPLPPFPSLVPGTLTTDTVRWLARCADLAYSKEEVIAPQVQAVGFAPFWLDESSTSTQVWVGSDEQRAVVAFRGTDSAPDWRSNGWATKSTPEWLPGVEVHHGFLRALEPVVARIDSLVGNRPVWICGHSLGGAIATLYAARCLVLGRAVAGVVTIGQPRVGTASFAQFYQARLESRHIRIQNISDPVPRVAPSDLGWSHVGTRWLLDSNGLCTEVPWWRLALSKLDWSDPYKSARRAARDAIGEHACSEYLNRLAKV